MSCVHRLYIIIVCHFNAMSRTVSLVTQVTILSIHVTFHQYLVVYSPRLILVHYILSRSILSMAINSLLPNILTQPLLHTVQSYIYTYHQQKQVVYLTEQEACAVADPFLYIVLGDRQVDLKQIQRSETKADLICPLEIHIQEICTVCVNPFC